MTVDELKKAMREYAEEHFPGGWGLASFQLRLGDPDKVERFIVLPDDPSLPQPPIAS